MGAQKRSFCTEQGRPPFPFTCFIKHRGCGGTCSRPTFIAQPAGEAVLLLAQTSDSTRVGGIQDTSSPQTATVFRCFIYHTHIHVSVHTRVCRSVLCTIGSIK